MVTVSDLDAKALEVLEAIYEAGGGLNHRDQGVHGL